MSVEAPDDRPDDRPGDLQDKVVLVSGGTQGVGAAVARAAVVAGARSS